MTQRRALITSIVTLAALTLSPRAIATPAATAYDFTFDAIEGGPMPLAQFQGQVMLVVNTASLCGFTPQYRDLQTLWENYQDRGLVVVGLPSDDFGGQEYASNDQIKEFCEVNFNVTFPLSEQINVKGRNAHPFYNWAKDTLGAKHAPRWNFHKYLIDRQGQLVTSFPTNQRPTDPKVTIAIEQLLAQVSS